MSYVKHTASPAIRIEYHPNGTGFQLVEVDSRGFEHPIGVYYTSPYGAILAALELADDTEAEIIELIDDTEYRGERGEGPRRYVKHFHLDILEILVAPEQRGPGYRLWKVDQTGFEQEVKFWFRSAAEATKFARFLVRGTQTRVVGDVQDGRGSRRNSSTATRG